MRMETERETNGEGHTDVWLRFKRMSRYCDLICFSTIFVYWYRTITLLSKNYGVNR